ncbi:MAG TPA: hypothetical protein VER17_12355 [Tepidisphaeraceae bacterium]|nr:hypothetical protein [Tepidisphaeraceae bacterium]
MSPEQLRRGMRWLTRRLYSARATRRRRKPFFENFRRQKLGVAV